MKQIMKMKSMLFGAMALFMLATMSFTLTSCDDDDENVTIYRQWVISTKDYVDDPEFVKEVSAVAFDFSDKTVYRELYQAAISIDGYKKGHWYIVDEIPMLVTETSETTGTITVGSNVSKYTINGKKLVLEVPGGTFVLKAAKGIKGEEMPITEK